MLSDPVSYLYMVGMCVFGETGRLGLLGREKPFVEVKSIPSGAGRCKPFQGDDR
jgi:hypothetical protein